MACRHAVLASTPLAKQVKLFARGKDLFEKTAVACGWPHAHWLVRLILLLSGEAQVAGQQLSVPTLLVYEDLKLVILRVGRSPEQLHQCFRSVELGDRGQPFVMAQQLCDASSKWLMLQTCDVEEVVYLVVLEQLIARLP